MICYEISQLLLEYRVGFEPTWRFLSQDLQSCAISRSATDTLGSRDGIRTRETLSGLNAFQAFAINHSATLLLAENVRIELTLPFRVVPISNRLPYHPAHFP